MSQADTNLQSVLGMLFSPLAVSDFVVQEIDTFDTLQNTFHPATTVCTPDAVYETNLPARRAIPGIPIDNQLFFCCFRCFCPAFWLCNMVRRWRPLVPFHSPLGILSTPHVKFPFYSISSEHILQRSQTTIIGFRSCIFYATQQSTIRFHFLFFLRMIFGLSDSISSPPIVGAAQARVLNQYLVWHLRSQVIDLSKREFTMGLNSNQFVGAVKASKRCGAARKKFVQKKPNNRKNQLGGLQKFGDGKGFNPNHHCVVCRARYLGCIKPHRPHHERCHQNKATEGQSTETIRVEKTAQGNLDKNNTPPASMKLTAGTTGW